MNVTPAKCACGPHRVLLPVPITQEPPGCGGIVLEDRFDRTEGQRRYIRLMDTNDTLTRDSDCAQNLEAAKSPMVSSRIRLQLPCALHPFLEAPRVKDSITFLVFFSYCRYLDSTTLPPADNTVSSRSCGLGSCHPAPGRLASLCHEITTHKLYSFNHCLAH